MIDVNSCLIKNRMKKDRRWILLLLLAVCYSGKADAETFSAGFRKDEVKKVMRSVADWQIAHQKEVVHKPTDWTNGAMYIGMADWAELAQQTDMDSIYYDFLVRISNRNGWQPGNRMYHADDICVSQMYIDLYQKNGNRSRLNPTLARTGWVAANPSRETMVLDYRDGKTLERWTWCDALFMAPPVYVRLYALTGDKKYMKFADREYKETYNHLYDKEERLFYRDQRYFDQREANGKKVFWGRGNGWVLGGLCEILQDLPARDKYRKFYEDLFVEMCHSVLRYQQDDGYWRASMLDPGSYPSPETSSTGFFVYAFAYGVNAGLLPADQFVPAVHKGWNALVAAVQEDGKLGYVQPIGADPKKVTRDMTEVYGVGAFLLAGNQVYKMSE